MQETIKKNRVLKLPSMCYNAVWDKSGFSNRWVNGEVIYQLRGENWLSHKWKKNWIPSHTTQRTISNGSISRIKAKTKMLIEDSIKYFRRLCMEKYFLVF